MTGSEVGGGVGFAGWSSNGCHDIGRGIVAGQGPGGGREGVFWAVVALGLS